MSDVKPVRWVGQQHTNGCLPAVAAMILGLEYEATCKMLTKNPDVLHSEGMGYFVLDSRLVDHGYAIARKYAVTQPGNRTREVWPCEPWADLHWCEVMPSEKAHVAHAVLMLADGTVLDPATPMPKRLTDYAKVNFIAAVVVVQPHTPETTNADT